MPLSLVGHFGCPMSQFCPSEHLAQDKQRGYCCEAKKWVINAARDGQYSFLRTERLQQCSFINLRCLTCTSGAQALQNALDRLTNQGGHSFRT